MIELSNKRTYTSKTFQNNDGTYTLKAHAGHIHYKGTDNSWKDVDYTLEDKGTYWQMVKASYKLLVAKDFGASQLIRFQNRFRGANHEIIYEPKMLAWVNKTDLSDFKIFRTQQPVKGYLLKHNVIRYDNAFGDGIHFEIEIRRSGFRKEIVIDAKNKLELPPTTRHKLVALFQYTGTGLKVKSNDKLREWNKTDYFEETNGFRVQETANEAFQSFIKPAFISDSSENQQNIKVFWKLHNGKLYQAKVLPTQFLEDAVYPVRADTITDYYAGAGDGYTKVDNKDWSTAHSATTADLVDYTGANTLQAKVRRDGSDSDFQLSRTFVPIDTSGLPDGASISAASLFMYIRFATDSFNDSYDYVTVVQTTQPSNTSLTTADFDVCGAITNPTEGLDAGNRIDITWADANENSYAEFVLNSTGIGWINLTGYTKLGLREGHDTTNNILPSGTYKSNEIWFYASEDTDGGRDPYLEITYSTGATNVTVTPAVVSVTSAVQSPTITAVKNISIAATVLAITASLIAPTISTIQNVSVSPNVLNPAFSVISPTITAIKNQTIEPTALSITASPISPTISTIQNINISPEVLSPVFTIPTPTISTVAHASVSPSVLAATFSIISPTISFLTPFGSHNFTLKLPQRDFTLKLPQRSFTLKTKI